MAKTDEHDRVSALVAEYARARSKYERFSKSVKNLIADYCGKKLIHATEYRAKSIESFEKKCTKIEKDGSLKYPDPLREITDFSGVRVIVFVRDSVDVICGEIGNLFKIIESEDVGERVYKQGKLGYQSKHLLVKLNDDHWLLKENKDFGELCCEVQVRTILQHAWAEMEHDIQYKTEKDIPVDINKRFSALAGLLELADREFQRIQIDSENLKAAVKDEFINELTKESLTISEDGKANGKREKEQSIAVRELVLGGKYSEAIDIYSKILATQPNSYTHYLGRARAKFLAGDTQGSVEDLDEVDRLRGDPSDTTHLRFIIEHGDDRRIALRSLTSEKISAQEQKAAAAAVRAGDGVKAFVEYAALEARGYNRAYVLFGKAISCAIELDTRGAKSYLTTLEIREATPMAVNICVLNWIIEILDNIENTELARRDVESALENFPNYSFNLSFMLQDFREGLRSKKLEQSEKIEEVFRLLEESAYVPIRKNDYSIAAIRLNPRSRRRSFEPPDHRIMPPISR